MSTNWRDQRVKYVFHRYTVVSISQGVALSAHREENVLYVLCMHDAAKENKHEFRNTFI